jgi:hypothetical protein
VGRRIDHRHVGTICGYSYVALTGVIHDLRRHRPQRQQPADRRAIVVQAETRRAVVVESRSVDTVDRAGEPYVALASANDAHGRPIVLKRHENRDYIHDAVIVPARRSSVARRHAPNERPRPRWQQWRFSTQQAAV